MSKSSGIRAVGLSLTLLVGASSCAAPGIVHNEARGTLFQDAAPPPPGEALIYLYRPKKVIAQLEPATNSAIHAGDASSNRTIGDLKIGGYFPFYSAPGTVTFWVEGKVPAFLTTDNATQGAPPGTFYVTAGETYYVRWTTQPQAADQLALVDKGTGAREIRRCRSDKIRLGQRQGSDLLLTPLVLATTSVARARNERKIRRWTPDVQRS